MQALRLNAAPEAHLIKLAHVIEPEEWMAVESPPDALPGRDSRPIWGVELGGASESSAIAATWPSGRLEVFAAFPSRPDLGQRGRDDDVGDVYTRMSDEGSVIVLGDHTMDYAALIREGLARYGRPQFIVCSRRKLGELGDALASAGLGGVRIGGASAVQRGSNSGRAVTATAHSDGRGADGGPWNAGQANSAGSEAGKASMGRCGFRRRPRGHLAWPSGMGVA